MPHIFRFHAGRNNNIYDWKASDRIQPADVRDVMDKTNILSSSAGTSIPTPIARMFLFKTAFEITAAQVRDNKVDKQSIYAGLVSETLDLLELLYKNGSDETKFRYQKWVFDAKQDDATLLSFFGQQRGHQLLAESFKQAASQAPFNNRIETTLIYYREGNKEILAGGTSPFTFVFTSPNFRRKLRERGFRPISGLVSNDMLFDASSYTQLHERDESFIRYMESLIGTEGIGSSFNGLVEYVVNTRHRYTHKFNGPLQTLQDIHFNDAPLTVGSIHLKQLSQESYKQTINRDSDFKIELPPDSGYAGTLKPLFLLDRMPYEGQYSSPSSHWSANTRISEMEYPETTLDEIQERELPGMDGLRYPFFSSFDFFERNLIKLPGYALNPERFLTVGDNQTFLYPLKPIFFHLFPYQKLHDYLSVDVKNNQVTFSLRIPVYGPTKNRREFVAKKTYDAETTIAYGGILGIFPFTRAEQPELLYMNKYTVASYEKTNGPSLLDSVSFFKKTAIHTIPVSPVQRANYEDINTKTTYYQLDQSFDLIRLNFRKDNANSGGIVIPKFKEVVNGTEGYVYAIDFGTSNTHIEYGRIAGNDKVSTTKPFEIEERGMQMYLLNKPEERVSNDGADRYNDYERSTGFTIDTARRVTLREFVPFQIGAQRGASVRFPFRSAMCESNAFISNHANRRLFVDANIGFNIDEDIFSDNVRYKTDLKWLLERADNDPFNQNRVSLFYRELLLLIRNKVLLEESNLRGDITKLQLVLSYPISMGESLRNKLIGLFEEQKAEIIENNRVPVKVVTESVAPYYQLKSRNADIQNDTYCNIDIGGGTTDIVFIDKSPTDINTLVCYCSSFKFAGRQLWSSGHNEFNEDDNGFVSYYKSFIKKNDPKIYAELEKVFAANTSRTEDLVGLLFSKPEYKFKDIFSSNKEFRVVPLVHYAAILYYIARFAELKNLKLPRTISFSGKGSEYLSLVFFNNNDLKGFTQKLLGIFSGKATRNDFNVERSAEPKVITAKGAAHFATERVEHDDDAWGTNAASNGTEKKMRIEEIKYKGFGNAALETDTMRYADLLSSDELFADIMNNHRNFFNLLFDDPQLNATINQRLELKDFASYKSFFVSAEADNHDEGSLRDSFKSTLAAMNPSDKISDSPFFFPLNFSLIRLSKEISQRAVNDL